MAVISSKAGKIITKAPVKSFFKTGLPGPEGETDGSGPTLTDESSSSGSTSGAYTYAAALEKLKQTKQQQQPQLLEQLLVHKIKQII